MPIDNNENKEFKPVIVAFCCNWWATANYVPAAAVIRRGQALSGFTGCKGSAGGTASWM